MQTTHYCTRYDTRYRLAGQHNESKLQHRRKRKGEPLRARPVQPLRIAQAISMSLDCTSFTPAFSIAFQAAASEPCKSMPREASSITETWKPNLRASSADQATQ